MTIPVQVTFRDVDSSPAVEAAIREHAAKFERFHGRITGCHVTVESPHHRGHQGRLYNVRIEIVIPGGTINATHSHGKDRAHEDVYVAIRDAFNAAARQLEDRARIDRHEVKHKAGD